MKRLHSFLAVFLAGIMIFLLCGCSEMVQGSLTPSLDIPTVGLNVESHTRSEIIRYITSGRAGFSDPVRYSETPWVPAKPGKLSQQTKASALTILNNFRYIAGLEPVEWDETKEAEQQAACLVNAVNGMISHTPKKPATVSDELYQLGYKGANTSNLGAGYDTLNRSILGYVSDVSVPGLGHRRWCLNPAMGSVCMGAVSGTNGLYKNYYSMYALDISFTGRSQTVAWPAQVTPLEYFDSNAVWSLSLGEAVNESDVQVIVQKKGGQTWTFSSDHRNGSFAVYNDSYGQPGCITFQPTGVSYRDGDQFVVTVIIEGREQAIQYTVSFFNMK